MRAARRPCERYDERRALGRVAVDTKRVCVVRERLPRIQQLARTDHATFVCDVCTQGECRCAQVSLQSVQTTFRRVRGSTDQADPNRLRCEFCCCLPNSEGSLCCLFRLCSALCCAVLQSAGRAHVLPVLVHSHSAVRGGLRCALFRRTAPLSPRLSSQAADLDPPTRPRPQPSQLASSVPQRYPAIPTKSVRPLSAVRVPLCPPLHPR